MVILTQKSSFIVEVDNAQQLFRGFEYTSCVYVEYAYWNSVCVMGVGLYVGCSQFDEGNTVNTTRFCPGLTTTTGGFHGTCIL